MSFTINKPRPLSFRLNENILIFFFIHWKWKSGQFDPNTTQGLIHYLFLVSLPTFLQSGYFSSMFSGSWKESNMMEINLEIPDQNIDTEGKRLQSPRAAVNCVYLFYWYNFTVLCVFSSTSRVWIVVPGWCSYQAQQSCQYSRRCLYATAGQYIELKETQNYHHDWLVLYMRSYDTKCNQVSWFAVVYRMAWSSSVARPWRKTSVPRLCVASMLVPASMAWT